ncbi:MAG: hypothetical protein KKE12_10295 [Proteobacteria bacterium]|nr:hypothetical protein [Pseudomonadota bacterium]
MPTISVFFKLTGRNYREKKNSFENTSKQKFGSAVKEKQDGYGIKD